MTKKTWKAFVEARYPELVRAAVAIVGQREAADAVQGALLRAENTENYRKCETDPFTWVMSAVRSVAANRRRSAKTTRAVDELFEERRAKPESAAGGISKPRHELGSRVDPERSNRKVRVLLSETIDPNDKKAVEAERRFQAETLAMLARIRANRQKLNDHE